MPKTTNTRKQKAKDLLKTAITGPSFYSQSESLITIEEAKAQYKIWSSSWIVPKLRELVPELHKLATQEHEHVFLTGNPDQCFYCGQTKWSLGIKTS